MPAATPSTAQELFRSLDQLRQDPLIASVLRGDPNDGHRRSSTFREPSPTRSAAIQESSSSARGALTAAELEGIALKNASEQYYRSRDANRDTVGVSNWVQTHRDEVSNADARRVESRLRSERLFAQTQLEVEKFRLEHSRSSPSAASNAHNNRSISPAKETQTSPPLAPEASPTPPKPVSPQPQAPQPHAAPSMYPTYPMSATSQPSFLSPLHSELHRFHSTSSVRLDTQAELGPIDEDENYRAKAAALLASTAVDGNLRPESVAAGHHHNENSANDVTARVVEPFLNTTRRDEADALRQAVEQRDRTIHRLERQLAQDRDYYEQELQRCKSDAHEERVAAEGRIVALRAQVDQLVSSRAGRNAHETTVEEMTIKLQTVQRMYRDSIDEIRRAAAEQSDAMEKSCEERVRHIAERAEKAIREAKDTYRVDRSEYLTSQKERLVELVQREQNLLLREAEDTLKHVVQTSVEEKLFSEIELSFRKHLQADIMPALQEQMRRDTTELATKQTREAADGIFAVKTVELQQAVKQRCLELQEELVKRFTSTADGLLVGAPQADRSSSERETSNAPHLHLRPEAVQQVKTSTANIDRAIAATAAEALRQQDMDALHSEKMGVYRRRIDQIESAIESEKTFANAIRDQVAQASSAAAGRYASHTGAEGADATDAGGAASARQRRAATAPSAQAPPWAS